jgi:aspartate aminotransferase
MKLAARMSRLGTESAFEVLARAKAAEAAGRTVIHLEIGEPDFATPPHIVEAAVQALRAGHTHYVPAPGIPAAREAVSAFLERTGRLKASPDRVVITPGAKPVMWYTMLALCDEGDEVIYPDPGFPMYESIASFVGAVPVPVPLREANGFRMDPAELESLVTERTRLVILNSPHNPCGGALTQADCEAVAEVALRHDLTVLSDEVYWAIRYDGRHASVLDIDGMAERTVLLDGWSKTFAMTGWRLGFGVFPPALVEPVTRLVINSVSCTSAFSQHAAVAALAGPWQPVEAMVTEFRARRDVIVKGLNQIPGISCAEPAGAFYVFPNVTGLGLPASALAGRLLDEAGVACLSGTAFGRHGEGYLRLSYANSVENLEAALAAIAATAAELAGHA